MFFSTLHAPLFVLSAYAVGVLAVSAVSDATRDRKWTVFWLAGHLMKRPPASVVNDSTQSGAGGYTIEPSNLSIHVDTGDIPKDIYRNVEDIANIKLSRGLAASNSGKEFGFRGCNEDQMYDILDAIDASRKYIATVEAHLAQRGGGPYYKTWFGQNGLDRLTRVRENIANLKKYTLVGYTADCHTCRAPRPNLWRTYIFQSGNDHSDANEVLEQLILIEEL